MGGGAAFVHPVGVVEGLGAIEADADQEIVAREEARPGGVDQGGVGLQGVGDDFMAGTVFALEGDGAREEFAAHEEGLAALPGEDDFGAGLGGDVLVGVGFQCGVVHAEAAVGVEAFFGEVVAVGAGEVADCAARFGK